MTILINGRILLVLVTEISVTKDALLIYVIMCLQEECEDLRERVKGGLLKRLTVVHILPLYTLPLRIDETICLLWQQR